MENEMMNVTPEETVDNAEEIAVVAEVEENATEAAPAEESAVEEADDAEEPSALESAKEKLTRKCTEVKNACCSTAERIARDLKETNYNPYFRQTRTYKLEVFRDCNDETPVDVYETTDVKSFSARALVVAGTAAMLLTYATNCVLKKILK